MIPSIKRLITIESVVTDAGLRIIKGKALCPFHHDTVPSMTFKYDRFKCWSCGAGGDIIDFTERFYGLDKKAAIEMLAGRAGISTVRPSSEVERQRRDREKREQLLKEFRAWEQKRVNLISAVLCFHRQVLAGELLSEADFIALAEVTCIIPEIEWEYDILCTKDDDMKLELYGEAIRNGRGSI